MAIIKDDYFDLVNLSEASYGKFDKFDEAKGVLTRARARPLFLT
jgi:hypothetical protein